MKRLVLLGGGHSHVEVIRRLGRDPPRGTRVVLVSPERHTPYSGMLPGFVAGHYGFHDCHIDLEPLCRLARVEFRTSHARGIEPGAGRVLCSDGAALDYDVLSIDIGATPDAESIRGAPEHALPVKPVSDFLRAWDRIQSAARDGKGSPSIAVVGAGAGGVELALALRYRLGAPGNAGARPVVFHLLAETATILPDHSPRVRRKFEHILRSRGIAVHVDSKVTRIEAGLLHREQGAPLAVDHTVLATTARAPRWLGASGLTTDAHGFILVNEALQSFSHPAVFAAGDVASMRHRPLPKSGVYAVRQGPPLAENLRRALAGHPLVKYAPQATALALISTGDRHAVASWRSITFEGSWVWHWKDRIDRRFVARYRVDAQRPEAVQ